MTAREAEKELWRRFRASDAVSSEPDTDALAEWEECRLSGRPAGPIETWLADDVLARSIFVAEQRKAEPPARAVQRAMSLVRDVPAAKQLRSLHFRRSVFATAAGIASLLVLIVSFNLGGNAFDARNFAENRIAAALWSES